MNRTTTSKRQHQRHLRCDIAGKEGVVGVVMVSVVLVLAMLLLLLLMRLKLMLVMVMLPLMFSC